MSTNNKSRNLLFTKKPHSAKPGISKAQGYIHSIYTIPYDLKGIIETIGAARTMDLVQVLAEQVRRERHNATTLANRQATSTSNNALAQRVIASKGETALQKQITASVSRSLNKLKASKQISRPKKKAA